MRILRPTTKWGRMTVWLGVLCSLLWIAAAAPNSTLSAWTTLVTIVFVFCALVLLIRWGYRPLLWRLRNRLIVTYLFIGVMPILLLLVGGALAGYMFAGQFATYVAVTDLHSELMHLQAANDGLAAQLLPLQASGKLDEKVAAEFTRASDERFPHRTVTVSRNEKGFLLSTGGEVLHQPQEPLPSFINGDFTNFVLDHDALHLRAVRLMNAKGERVAVISDLPITPELLEPTTAQLGEVTVIPPAKNGNIQIPPPPESVLKRAPVTAGSVPARFNRFDLTLRFLTLFDVVDWETGKKLDGEGGIFVATRPSTLYATLFATLGEKASFFRVGLLTVAIFFGIIELVALYIGVRLSRSMTASVADLYHATEHVNRGDLTHRIQINGHDQMAALEGSFNSMTGSLAKLLDEQKEKQRLENELSIAYEVQELLFPNKNIDMPSIEVHGVCVPARTVSGDYYDFIPLGTDRLVLAVGDISGKGISAALLMATVHAFVRAYSLEPEVVRMPALLEYSAQSQGDSRMYYRGDRGVEAQLAPAMLMTTLNYQLYRSTPAAKYATMFLGCYDPQARVLRYCNAGHLPPMILRTTGEVLPLDVNGTVVGLFDGVTYEESTVVMEPGDIFIAYSDGVTEPENEFGEFGEDRLVALVKEHRRKPLQRIAEIVTGAVADWIGAAEQPDDVTVVLARCTAPSR
jgi:sigma-B regulation protein RsbU (phosphoserine phosphatase)